MKYVQRAAAPSHHQLIGDKHRRLGEIGRLFFSAILLSRKGMQIVLVRYDFSLWEEFQGRQVIAEVMSGDDKSHLLLQPDLNSFPQSFGILSARHAVNE